MDARTAIAALGMVRRAGLRWSGLSWREAHGAARAMRTFLQSNRVCEWCGRPASVAHHLTPVSVMPDAADDPENLVAACRRCHLNVWHAGSWRRWVQGLRFMMLQGKIQVCR